MKKPTHKPLIRAKAGQCRWIIEGTEGASALVCGEAVKLGSSYCPHHHGIVYKRSAPSVGRIREEYVSAKAAESDHEPDLIEMLA
jgi:hypothetical protein